ncbi:MAG: hypothetical protein AB9917_22635 [Negativicutes bacterium]
MDKNTVAGRVREQRGKTVCQAEQPPQQLARDEQERLWDRMVGIATASRLQQLVPKG